jgi:O-acetylhomoserine (thiol)-lyase
MSANQSARGFTTAILHSDRDGGVEHGALHKPLHLSVAYGYRDARELAAVFQGRAQGFAYGRQGNPTSAALEAKVTGMEDGIATVCFATGMAAIGAACWRSEGAITSSPANSCSATPSVFTTLAAHGAVSFVGATDVANVEHALTRDAAGIRRNDCEPRTQVRTSRGSAPCAQRRHSLRGRQHDDLAAPSGGRPARDSCQRAD